MSKQITCKLTGELGKAIRSHIIPKSFFNLKEPENPPLIMSADGSFKKSRIGIYDDGLVTARGEEYFKNIDDYAYKILISKRDSFIDLTVEGQKVGKALLDYDYKKLKLFFLSLLWRASETAQPPFSAVGLGPHSPLIKDMILNGNPGSPEDYAVILFRFPEAKSLQSGTTLFPFPARISDRNWYRFFLCEYCALIKVDSQKTPSPFDFMKILPDEKLCVFDREFPNSPEAKVVNQILTSAEGKLPNWFVQAARANRKY